MSVAEKLKKVEDKLFELKNTQLVILDELYKIGDALKEKKSG